MRFYYNIPRALEEQTSWIHLFSVVLILFLLCLAFYYFWAMQPRKGTVEWIHLQERKPFRFLTARHPLDKWDAVAIVAIMLLWAVIAFWNLGDREAPQSFHVFEGEVVEIDLGQETDLGIIRYYSGLNMGAYALYTSRDGSDWINQGDMIQNHVSIFKWNEIEIRDGGGVRYIRISAREGQPHLGELAIYDAAETLLDSSNFTLWWPNEDQMSYALFDEQHLVPQRPGFMNSSYFDEIYHARTAYEHLQGVNPYEISHPPLGKLIISIGIAIFGLVPFGWRFMGTLFGVLMLLPLYCMIKGMFGKRIVAICGTLVFAFDFMHFAQTRIATIDTYAVFFIILMFWFIYRYISHDYETPVSKMLPDLFFAGLFFGLGAAAKWTSLYFGLAMAILYLIYQFLRGRHWIRSGRGDDLGGYLVKTVLASLVFFILIPGMIYYLSYIPYGVARDYPLFSREYLQLVLDNQEFMWDYHQGVTEEHSFSSRWYQWIFNLRPILYYQNFLPDGIKSAISAFGNPALYWGGLLAILVLPVSAVRQRDGRALAILVGYVTLLFPWLFIDRPTFAYHYFTNTIFLTLALAYAFDRLMERKKGAYKTIIIAFTAVTVGLFVLFYPALSGRPVSIEFTDTFLRWWPSWQL